jgi:hypothetical protein
MGTVKRKSKIKKVSPQIIRCNKTYLLGKPHIGYLDIHPLACSIIIYVKKSLSSDGFSTTLINFLKILLPTKFHSDATFGGR